jgi:UDP-N-acetylmuramoyl-L-alanyl-D-glutamate--2,6-diaminopimelate ligase
VAALRFRVAAFSNLTQDHLDFHGSLAAYGETKARLFSELTPAHAVLNVDDAFGAELARRAHGRVWRVSKRGPADVYAAELRADARGIAGSVVTPAGELALASRLVGEHNLDNLLLATGILLALGYAPAAIGAAMGALPQVPGRLERCDEPGDELAVLVDYAHTPDALERVLRAVRGLTRGRVLCVFGCGGDRDPLKRPKMGAAVAQLADRAFLSNDNPRSEDPRKIAEQVEVGLRGGHASYEIELDRARAIERAVLEAAPGEVVLIAGKGHEPYQLIGAERLAFDDRLEARRALAKRRAGAS